MLTQFERIVFARVVCGSLDKRRHLAFVLKKMMSIWAAQTSHQQATHVVVAATTQRFHPFMSLPLRTKQKPYTQSTHHAVISVLCVDCRVEHGIYVTIILVYIIYKMRELTALMVMLIL